MGSPTKQAGVVNALKKQPTKFYPMQELPGGQLVSISVIGLCSKLVFASSPLGVGDFPLSKSECLQKRQ